ncbi:glycoside hydrolase superfamily [Gloeopeniophorella convolvens]|nr:glycoside hydrolase superfamily [Gloeopeniophorella convolvens]
MRFSLLALAALGFLQSAAASPKKIYGVNLGSWLVLEAWMLPAEWEAMGGQSCSDCSTCIATESAFAKAYPDTVDQKFAQHWATWFTQDDVNKLKAAGINTARIPLGYWIVEALVDRPNEAFPRGGIKYLTNGLKMLKDAGIQAILDHHALPGVQTPGQMFTGNCTSDVQFYTDYNYGRALTWTAVMTILSHLHPDFSTVFAIEAVNEPIMDASQTPGYGEFQKNFVQTVRAAELLLGISVPGHAEIKPPSGANLTVAFAHAQTAGSSGIFIPNSAAVKAVAQAIPILIRMAPELGFSILDPTAARGRSALTTNIMDINWQHNNPANPAAAAIGPQAYDNHLYYSFGGVADANPDAYMRSICNLQRVQDDAAVGNSPLWFGEWAVTTQFDATDDFLFMWADAQKLAYSQGELQFWNFKVETSDQAGDLGRQWSYFEGLERGYFTQDPSKVHNPQVCDPYIGNATTTSTTTTATATTATATTTTAATATTTTTTAIATATTASTTSSTISTSASSTAVQTSSTEPSTSKASTTPTGPSPSVSTAPFNSSSSHA